MQLRIENGWNRNVDTSRRNANKVLASTEETTYCGSVFRQRNEENVDVSLDWDSSDGNASAQVG
ncbi:hypothetical protein Csa_012052 [Cucumis sativus]|uniref:Uncharacterized protein n=1 Tax=Cucumis sativus TaxID=3659 RepID=A0A0A0L418_CUCSA|nr:hypothetical protein Csa_012052 [Cucumis sativus]